MKITRKELRKLIMEQTKVMIVSDEIKQDIQNSDKEAEEKLKAANPDASDEEIDAAKKQAMTESLEKIGFYKKYSYGLDDIPNQTKAHDDIIGHTWLTHVKRKGSALNEIGKVLWHSLDENGHIAIYDVEWPSSGIETDIPAILLEKVKDSDDISEKLHHEAHGVDGHEEDLLEFLRKYKK